MASSSITAEFEKLPQIAKVLLVIFLGWIICPAYRILRYFEKKNTTTLVVGILCIIPPIDLVATIVDAVTEATANRITYFVD